MATILTRQDLTNFALRQLGGGVVNIEISPEQIEDNLDLAIDFYREYHFEGVARELIKYQILAADVTNGYIPMPDAVLGIRSILTTATIYNSTEMLYNFQYQIMANEIQRIGAGQGIQYMSSVLNYMAHIDFFLRKEKQFRFHRRMNKMYIDTTWGTELKEGDWIVVDAYVALDPQSYPEIYNDIWLRKYVKALFHKQWAQNMSKYGNMTLPGGLVYDSDKQMQIALKEIEELEAQAIENGAPLQFYVG